MWEDNKTRRSKRWLCIECICVFFILCIVVLIASLFWLYSENNSTSCLSEFSGRGKNRIVQDLAFRHYTTKRRGGGRRRRGRRMRRGRRRKGDGKSVEAKEINRFGKTVR